MLRSKPNLHVLDATDKLLLGNEYEYIYVIDKEKNTSLILGGIYGDPEFGLIDKNDNWCLAGGSWLFLLKKGGEIIEIQEPDIAWVVKARQVSDAQVELLVDPWSEKGAIWLLDIATLKKHKIRDFKITGEFDEDIDW